MHGQEIMDNAAGTIFQIQRWSVNDGEGIRSTVFLKGCPLRCRWCANPESWRSVPEVLFLQERCGACGHCIQVCPAGAIRLEAGANKSVPIAGLCQGCGKCCQVCPAGARKQIGYRVTVEEVMRVVKRDAVFYRESGGGVTFSGGEPFAQPEFLRQLVRACNRAGIDTAVETCGHYEWEQVKDIFEQLDGVFVDIKHMDDAMHKRWAGEGNCKILENIKHISGVQPNTIVRVPLVAEVNATVENIRSMCEFLLNHTKIRRVELLPYHDLGEAKQDGLGGRRQSFTAPDDETIGMLKQLILDHGLDIVDFR